jgi:ATP-dependent DNA ligase
MTQMRTARPDEARLMFFVFDILHENDVGLANLALHERKRDLHRLCSKVQIPFLREIQSFPNGELLLRHCDQYQYEGVVSKRLASRYSSGASRNWLKTKCPSWARANANRSELFQRPNKPELTEDQRTLARKREQLRRLQERLQASDMRPGIARELRKQATVLEQQITQLDILCHQFERKS